MVPTGHSKVGHTFKEVGVQSLLVNFLGGFYISYGFMTVGSRFYYNLDCLGIGLKDFGVVEH